MVQYFERQHCILCVYSIYEDSLTYNLHAIKEVLGIERREHQDLYLKYLIQYSERGHCILRADSIYEDRLR